jgi:hypothetical protein
MKMFLFSRLFAFFAGLILLLDRWNRVLYFTTWLNTWVELRRII